MNTETPSEIYKNAPLVEAVFEIKFPGEPSIECHRDLFYEKVRTKYSSIFVPQVSAGEAPSLSPYRFMDAENASGFLFSINSLAFSSKKYKGFISFKEELLIFFKIFKDLYKINKLVRTGLRFINIIPFLRADKNVFPIKDYLNIDIGFPSSIPHNFSYFQTRFTTRTNDGVITTNIQPLTSLDKKNEVILLDFDYSKTGNLFYKDIELYLEESHKNTKIFFESLITDSYRSIIKGVVI